MLAFVAALVALAAFLGRFFPAPDGTLAGDWAYFLPRLLAGLYWYAQNGALAVPYFSPAFCGGLPFLANPQSLYYSLPQLLSLWVGPLAAAAATAVGACAWCGLWGVALLRRRFGCSAAAAWFGGALYLLNGFLVHRMIVGHLTYHGFALLPTAALVTLAPPGRRTGEAGAACATGAVFAYLCFSGALNFVVPFALCLVGTWLVHGLVREPVPRFWPRLVAGGVLGAAAAAAKLVPAAAYVSGFPRGEPMMLFPLGTVVGRLAAGLFHPAALGDFRYRNEFELGLGPVAALALVAGVAVACGPRRAELVRRMGRRRGLVAALVAVLALPLLLTWDGPGVEGALRTLPYVRSNVILTRWWVVWIAVLVPLAAAALEHAAGRHAAVLAALGIATSAAALVLPDHAYYRTMPYDPRPVERAAARLRADGVVPPIRAVGGRDANALARGVSHDQCYEPLFGYRRQSLPWAPRGTVRDPACFLYGAANGCRPGDAFPPERGEARRRFLAYRTFPFVRPWWQTVANGVSVVGILAIVVGAGAALGRR